MMAIRDCVDRDRSGFCSEGVAYLMRGADTGIGVLACIERGPVIIGHMGDQAVYFTLSVGDGCQKRDGPKRCTAPSTAPAAGAGLVGVRKAMSGAIDEGAIAKEVSAFHGVWMIGLLIYVKWFWVLMM